MCFHSILIYHESTYDDPVMEKTPTPPFTPLGKSGVQCPLSLAFLLTAFSSVSLHCL